MFDVKKVELEWAGKNLIIETGKIARQADASVIVTYGGTTVMTNVVAAKKVKPDMDFFPAHSNSTFFTSNIFFLFQIRTNL